MRRIYNHLVKSRKFEYFIFTFILVGSFVVRLYKINSPIADWHSWRQVDTAAVARIYLNDGIDLLNPRYYDISSIQTGYVNPLGKRLVEFPIYNAIHTLSYKAFPKISFEAWGRLISIFCSLGTIVIVYLLGRKYIGNFGGILGAFFVGFVPFSIYYSRVILPESMATFVAVAGIWFFSQYIDRDSKIELFLGAIMFSVSLLVKPYAAFYGLVIVYLVIKKFGIKKIFTNIPLLLSLDIALIPFLLWRAWIFPQIEGIPHLAWAFNGDAIRFRPAFWRWIFAERLGNLILGMWGLVPFSLGLIVHSRDDKKKDWVIELMALSMFAFVSVVATASVRHDYYQSIAVPAIALTWAKGFDYLWKIKIGSAVSAKIFLIFSTGMMLGMGAYKVKEYYKINHNEFVEVGAVVDRLTPKDAKVIAPDNGNTVFLYYTKRQGWPVLEEGIDAVIAKGADYYVSVNNDADTNMFKNKFETVASGKDFVLLDLHKPKK